MQDDGDDDGDAAGRPEDGGPLSGVGCTMGQARMSRSEVGHINSRGGRGGVKTHVRSSARGCACCFIIFWRLGKGWRAVSPLGRCRQRPEEYQERIWGQRWPTAMA